MSYGITLIKGDGVGPEVSMAMKKCVDALGVDIDWDLQEAGVDVLKKEGTPLPLDTIRSVKKNKIAIKGPITTPVGYGFRSINVLLRKTFDLYQNIRPAKSYKGVSSRYSDVDIVVFRENTDDLYVGVEFEKGKKNTLELIKKIKQLNSDGKIIRDDSGISIKPISVFKSKRIVEAAFKYAKANNRKKVSLVHKANIMKYTDGLFLNVGRQVAKKYKTEFEDVIVDNLCMQLVQKPEKYDVLVLPNLYGDIVSDLCAGLVGGLGVAPSANIGDKYAMFEAVHGSAPKYAGKNKVNPTALILSSVMMLRYLKEFKAASRLEKAVASVIASRKNVTYDLRPKKAVGTSQMAEAVVRKIKR